MSGLEKERNGSARALSCVWPLDYADRLARPDLPCSIPLGWLKRAAPPAWPVRPPA